MVGIAVTNLGSRWWFCHDPEGRRDDTLYLSVAVQCSSRPDQDVEKCDKCCARDYKAAKGKDNVKARTNRDSSIPEIASLSVQEEGDHLQNSAEASSIISFKGPKRQQFNGGNLYLSLYLRCYCSHHNEPNGYRHVDSYHCR